MQSDPDPAIIWEEIKHEKPKPSNSHKQPSQWKLREQASSSVHVSNVKKICDRWSPALTSTKLRTWSGWNSLLCALLFCSGLCTSSWGMCWVTRVCVYLLGTSCTSLVTRSKSPQSPQTLCLPMQVSCRFELGLSSMKVAGDFLCPCHPGNVTSTHQLFADRH